MDQLNKQIQDKQTQIAERLQELRRAKGFSAYEEFAFKNKINRSTYGRMEQGRNMRMDSFLQALIALDITLEDFHKGLK